MLSSFNKAINAAEFIITCELSPPKGINYSKMLELAKPLKNLVHAINITDGQGANMHMNSIIASHLLERESGIESICQLVCRDRNSIALQADLLGALALDIKNFLVLSGDKSSNGDHATAKDVFELGTDDLIKIFGQFACGLDLMNNKINQIIPAENNCFGAAAHPGVEDLKAQSNKMKQRIEAGAKFFQTQIVYDLEQLKRFLDSIENIKVPVLIGITPLKSVKMANFMNEKIYGVTVPDNLIERLASSDNQQEEGFKIAAELINEVKALNGSGVHIMAIGQESCLPQIIETSLSHIN